MARTSRSPRGERGLKRVSCYRKAKSLSRSPRGERGLKPCRLSQRQDDRPSLPVWERGLKHNIVEAARYAIVSLPACGDWIETCSQSSVRQAIASLHVWYIFRSVSVHLQNKRAECHLFRSIPIHFTIGELQSATFPVHIRSLCFFSVIDKASDFIFQVHIRSL